MLPHAGEQDIDQETDVIGALVKRLHQDFQVSEQMIHQLLQHFRLAWHRVEQRRRLIGRLAAAEVHRQVRQEAQQSGVGRRHAALGNRVARA